MKFRIVINNWKTTPIEVDGLKNREFLSAKEFDQLIEAEKLLEDILGLKVRIVRIITK